jgi:hypothetical protein
MGVMMMNMCSGKVEQDKPDTVEYDDEIMSSGWNPVIGLQQLKPGDGHKSFPAELSDVNIDQFLKKMYG